MSMRRKSSIGIVAMVALLLMCSSFVKVHHVSAESRYGANYFPDVPLTTQDGKVVHFYSDLLKGKVVAIDLIYTNCHFSCPLETARMAQVQKILGDRVGKDIFFYSISIDPKRDTPAQLKTYAAKYHIAPGWLFLTGKKEDIDLISKKLGLYTASDTNQDGHTPGLMLGDEPNGLWMRNSAVDNPRFLATTIMNNFLKDGESQTGTGKSYAEATAIHMDKGQYLFSTRCAACHTIGHGDKIGPDLAGVTNVREQNWLARFIARPDKMLAEKDPLAMALFKSYKKLQMPNLRMGPDDVNSLIQFLKTQGAAVRGESTRTKAAAAEKGNRSSTSAAVVGPNVK
jgi:protein SCO1/2